VDKSMKTKILFYSLLTLMLGTGHISAAQEILRGKVVNASQEPVVGVSVQVLGDESRSASSGADGTFSVSVNVGETLRLTSVEYDSQNVVVRTLQPLTVTMQSKDEILDEVVVIGYGTQRRSDVIAPVSKFNAEGLEERPLVRVDQALVGQMSGVRVKQTTDIPRKCLSVQVRGSGSITAGTEPLYVIDGFPLGMAAQNGSGNYAQGSPLDNINPNDIESIEVLKDAASAAIYGSRAANGVVLITTKRGKTGQPQISFNTYLGASSPYRKLDMLNGEEWIDRAVEMINSDWVASGAGRTATQTMYERRAIVGLNPGTYNTAYMYDERWLQAGRPGMYMIDWQDEAYRTGMVQNYQLGASGGTEYVNYYISGNYMDQKGIVRGVDYKNYALRANVDVKPTKKLTLGMNLAPTYSEANDPGVEGKDNIIHQTYSMTPVQNNPAG